MLQLCIDHNFMVTFLEGVNFLSDLAYEMGYLNQSIGFYYEMLTFSQKIKNLKYQYKAFVGIARVALIKEDLKFALKILKKALIYTWLFKKEELEIEVYEKLSFCLYKMGNLDESVYYHNRAMKQELEQESQEKQILISHLNKELEIYALMGENVDNKFQKVHFYMQKIPLFSKDLFQYNTDISNYEFDFDMQYSIFEDQMREYIEKNQKNYAQTESQFLNNDVIVQSIQEINEISDSSQISQKQNFQNKNQNISSNINYDSQQNVAQSKNIQFLEPKKNSNNDSVKEETNSQQINFQNSKISQIDRSSVNLINFPNVIDIQNTVESTRFSFINKNKLQGLNAEKQQQSSQNNVNQNHLNFNQKEQNCGRNNIIRAEIQGYRNFLWLKMDYQDIKKNCLENEKKLEEIRLPKQEITTQVPDITKKLYKKYKIYDQSDPKQRMQQKRLQYEYVQHDKFDKQKIYNKKDNNKFNQFDKIKKEIQSEIADFEYKYKKRAITDHLDPKKAEDPKEVYLYHKKLTGYRNNIAQQRLLQSKGVLVSILNQKLFLTNIKDYGLKIKDQKAKFKYRMIVDNLVANNKILIR